MPPSRHLPIARTTRGLAAAVLAAWTAGCTLGPDFKRPAGPAVANYTGEKPPAELNLAVGKDIPKQWWGLFQSPELNALIVEALQNSPDLQAAQASLTEANEQMLAKQGDLFPALDASVSGRRQQVSGSQFGNPGMGGVLFNLFNASVNVSYTLDVFGGIRRQIENLGAQIDYQRYQLEAARLTLAGNIVTTAVQEASLRAQQTATEQMLDAQSRQLEMLQKQLALGGIPNATVLAQQAALAQTRAALPPLQLQLTQARHRLAVLLGRPPGQKLSARFDLDKLQLPGELPLSLPSRLVEQRPDVRAQEALLHAASAQIGVVTAAQFPDLTLTASIGTIATRAGDLFIPGSGIWNISGNLLQPLFHGGEFLHKKRAAVADYKQVAAVYQSTVLQAFQNVADSLSALEYDTAELKAQDSAEQAARDSLELTRVQFQTGAASYLALLTAERDYQQARLGRIQAHAARLADAAALLQSLGGGWWQADKKAKKS